MDEADYAQQNDEFFRQNALRDHFLRNGNTQREAAMQSPGDPAQSTAERGSSGLHVCRDCGHKIGAARLKANPEAVRCVACQTKKERI